MRFFILGGSGRTGELVIEDALKRGHTIIALVRDPAKVEQRPGLTLVKGSPKSENDIRSAFMATPNGLPEVVIVTLNARRASDSPFAKPISEPRFMADSNAAAIAVMKEFSVNKIVIMSVFGAGDSWPNMHWLLRLTFRHTNMWYQTEDHNLVDQETKASGVKYVMVRPVMLTEGDAQPVVEHGSNGKGVAMMAKNTRGTVAKFLVDVAESNKWDNQTPVISN